MSQPLAWWLLKPLEQDKSDLSNAALAEMAMAGGAFDDLAAEPDLYSFSDGEAIVAGRCSAATTSCWLLPVHGWGCGQS